ncbi:MAG: hypothetical protein WCI27_04900 [Candidatus Omnitrophota bacterium]
MKRFSCVVLAGALCLGLATSAGAEKRVCAGADIVVRAEVGRMIDIYVEAGIADLVRSGDPATLKVEHASGHLFLTPLTAAAAGITILDTGGRSHRVQYVFGEGADDRIRVEDCRESGKFLDARDPGMDIMRALMQGRQPEGSVHHDGGPVVFQDAQVRLTLVSAEELPMAAGYVLSAENITDAPVNIPFQRISYPGLLAVAGDKDTLESRAKTMVYMVVRR